VPSQSAPVRRRPLKAAAVVVLLAALSGCGLGDAQEPPRDESGAVTEAASAGAFAIKVGDCLNNPHAEQLTEVEFVPCDQPHELEAFAASNLPDGDFPGDEEVAAKAEEFCVAEFKAFAGIPYDDSALELIHLNPTEESWSGEQDRELLCLVGAKDEPTTGTLKDSRR
jgi:predicted small lipoprotein YifL